MGNKIVTEADRKRSAAVKDREGKVLTREGGGQQISRARGTATRTKKSTGKRAHKGG